MSLLSLTHRPARLTLSALIGAPAEALRFVAHEWSIHRAVVALHALDDACLADIGVARGDIEAAVRHGRAGLSA